MQSENERLDFINVEDEMQRAYIDYSMSVIIGRALPDVRDGLKPVNRRILYAMRQGGWVHSRPFVKCARVVGEVMGKYHPHGDSAVYDTLVRMAQDFSLRAPLIHGQGNFGSIDGDPPAAQRYTECKLNTLSEELLADIDKNTVDMRPNYDETLAEPVVLPCRVPNLLLNGSTGIAVGMATNIPPHNLNELVDALVHMIDNPEATTGDLMQFVKGPDFPTAGIVHGLGPIKSMYETGRGLIKVRGKAEIEEDAKGRERIIITEIPYTVNKATLITKMAHLVKDKVLVGISDIRDESSKDGIRVVVEIKRDAMANVLLNNIYKHTQMETTFGAIMLAIHDGRPKVMNLQELLRAFLDHRLEVVTRRVEFDLEKAEARAHILEGYIIALDNMDEVVKVIRASKNRDEARTTLMSRFGLTEIQAKAILEMRLYQLTGLERDKIESEYKEVMELIAYLKDLLSSEAKIYGVIREDLLDVKKQFGTDRRTELMVNEGEIDIEDLIANKSFVITLSHAGYIKRVPITTYRQQRRGGKGVVGMGTKDEDYVEHVFGASAHDYVLFFTETGRLYWKKVYELPEGSRIHKGKAIVNLLELGKEEKIAAMIRVSEFSEDQSLIMATRNGTIKKTALSAYQRPRAGGIIGINIDDGDRLIGVREFSEEDEVMLVTREGMSIRFKSSQLRNQGRATRGVRGIRLGKQDDAVVSISKVEEGGTLMVMAEKGFGKRTEFSEYREQSRGGKGIITMKTTDKTGKVVGAFTVQEEDALMLVTIEGQIIRMAVNEIRAIGRSTQGVRLINLKGDDQLVSATRVTPEFDESAEPEDDEDNETAS